MIIRKATKKDLKDLAKIFRIEGAKPPYNRKRTLKKVLGIVKDDFRSNDVYVTDIDDKTVGFIMVKRDSGIKNKLWINELWILKEYQGKGIGKEIMNKIEKIYKNRGIKEFKLAADTRKGGAFGFYKKIGYSFDKSIVFMKKVTN